MVNNETYPVSLSYLTKGTVSCDELSRFRCEVASIESAYSIEGVSDMFAPSLISRAGLRYPVCHVLNTISRLPGP